MKNIILISLLLMAVACSHEDGFTEETDGDGAVTRSVNDSFKVKNGGGFTFRADTAWKDTIRIKF